jgi:histone H2A
MAKPKSAKKTDKKTLKETVEKTKVRETVQENEDQEMQEETEDEDVEMNPEDDVEHNDENQSPNVQETDDNTTGGDDTIIPAAKVDKKKAPAKAKASKSKKTAQNVDKVQFEKRGGDGVKKRNSLSQRAGTVFPVARVRKNLKNFVSRKLRVQVGAACYLTAVLEYLAAEIMELSVNVARDKKKRRIIPRHMLLAIKMDDELDQLLQHVTIAQGGVLKTVHPALLPKNSRSKKSLIGHSSK